MGFSKAMTMIARQVGEQTADLLGLLQLLSSLDGISLILGSPLSHLTVSFGHATLQLSLGLLFLLKLLPQQVTVVAGRLDTVGQCILSLHETHLNLMK